MSSSIVRIYLNDLLTHEDKDGRYVKFTVEDVEADKETLDEIVPSILVKKYTVSDS